MGVVFCGQCSAEFAPRTHQQRYCSPPCSSAANKAACIASAQRHWLATRPARPDVPCAGCAALIPPSTRGPQRKWCDRCKANAVPQREWYKNQRTPEKITRKRERARAEHLRVYGITEEQFDEQLARQAGRCAGCRTDDPGSRGWLVDHDHDTGKFRWVLCHGCNCALGFVGDDPVILRHLADLLEGSYAEHE